MSIKNQLLGRLGGQCFTIEVYSEECQSPSSGRVAVPFRLYPEPMSCHRCLGSVPVYLCPRMVFFFLAFPWKGTVRWLLPRSRIQTRTQDMLLCAIRYLWQRRTQDDADKVVRRRRWNPRLGTDTYPGVTSQAVELDAGAGTREAREPQVLSHRVQPQLYAALQMTGFSVEPISSVGSGSKPSGIEESTRQLTRCTNDDCSVPRKDVRSTTRETVRIGTTSLVGGGTYCTV